MTTPRTSVRWIGAALVSLLAVLAGCSGSGDDAGSPTGSSSTPASMSSLPITQSAVVASSLPTVTYTVAAGDYLVAIASATGVSVDDIVAANGWADGADHLIRPGDVIRLPSGATAGRPAPSSRPPGSGADETSGYVEVGSAALLGFGPDGVTEAIDDPLNDGTYYASSYSLTPDGSGIVFDLARFISAEACIDALPTVPTGTVDTFDCLGGEVDTSRTARVTLPVEGPVPVVLVFDCFATQSCTGPGFIPHVQVSSREFARLLRGEPPSAAAPAGFEYQPYWDWLVEIRNGSIVRVNQRYTS